MTPSACHECGVEVTAETGFRLTGALGDDTEDRVWCLEHGPSAGPGFSLGDLDFLKRGFLRPSQTAPPWALDQR